MSSYIIKGGKRLEGEVSISGSKNASLPILAACILNGKVNKLYNVPDISDVRITLDILNDLGCIIKKDKKKIIIDSNPISKIEIPDELMRKLRSSVILTGAMLARFKEVTFTYPGGCDIGARPIDLHLNSFKKLGIKINENSGKICCICDKIENMRIHLDFPSVGATENIILASVLGDKEVIIENAALEPEIVDLADFLKRMGAKIYGAGTSTIKIKGVKNLKEASYNIMPDRIEAGTILMAAAITGGKVKIKSVIPEHISPLLLKLEEAGCKIIVENRSISLIAPKRLKAVSITTMPYPGFPTDLQSVFTSILTVAKGSSIVTENIFENRFKIAPELIRMGAKIMPTGKAIFIKGVRKLHGSNVEAPDLRGGAALVLAGLVAKGTTKVSNIEYILRGYENLDLKLNSLLANIEREEAD